MKKSTLMKSLSKCNHSFAVALALAGSLLSASATEQHLLTIIFHDGHKCSYALVDRPKVTFDSNTLYVKAESMEDDFVLKDVNKFVFTTGTPTSIASVDANEYRFSFTDGENVVLEGHAAGTTVRLYDTAGKSVGTTKADSDGRATISLAGLPAGIYVISTADGTTYKVIKH